MCSVAEQFWSFICVKPFEVVDNRVCFLFLEFHVKAWVYIFCLVSSDIKDNIPVLLCLKATTASASDKPSWSGQFVKIWVLRKLFRLWKYSVLKASVQGIWHLQMALAIESFPHFICIYSAFVVIVKIVTALTGDVSNLYRCTIRSLPFFVYM